MNRGVDPDVVELVTLLARGLLRLTQEGRNSAVSDPRISQIPLDVAAHQSERRQDPAPREAP